MIFRLNTTGCYMLLLSGPATTKRLSFTLVKKTWDNVEASIIPWTEASWPRNVSPSLRNEVERTTITIECVGDQITVWINGHEIARIHDSTFTEGQVGMAAFGTGHVLFHNLQVEDQLQMARRFLNSAPPSTAQ